jgi:hypothetical protein
LQSKGAYIAVSTTDWLVQSALVRLKLICCNAAARSWLI